MSERNLAGSPEWLEQQTSQFSRIAPALASYATELRRILQSAAVDLAPLAIVQVRTKSPASFAQKALKKHQEHDCPTHQFTDLCGGRVIVRTRREVEAISRFVESSFDIDWANSVDTSRRLEPTEFGYRSIHYIVALNREDHGNDIPDGVFGFECGMCQQRYPLRAEIQVRTMVEHAWSDFSHDISYKGAFELPARFRREIALIAAELEDVDQAFDRVEKELRIYAADYGVHLDIDQLRERMAQIQMVLDIDPTNAKLGWEIGKLAVAADDLEQARRLFERFVDDDNPELAYQPLLRDLGATLCGIHEADPKHAGYVRGQQFLDAASDLDGSDANAVSALADTWRGIDDARASDLYRRAFELDPTDAYPLTRYLEHEVGHRGNSSILDVIIPLADRAVVRCDAQISVGVNLSRAYFGRGELQLLMGSPYDALDSYAKAVTKSASSAFVEDALEGLEILARAPDVIEGLHWVIDFLRLALATRFSANSATADLADRATRSSIRGPVVVVAGATDSAFEASVEGYRSRLDEAFADFGGSVISGGTRDGVAGLVGDLGSRSQGKYVAVGYVPETLDDTTIDDRYATINRIGDEFSPQQSLQSWFDLIASGVKPEDVKVLGINGGRIAAAEYQVAVALGATVGLVKGSGRAVGAMLADAVWAQEQGLLSLPDDPQTLRAFVGSGAAVLPDALRERLAERIHRSYCDERAKQQTSGDPAVAPWPELVDVFKKSNRLQADHIESKLRRVGYEVVSQENAQARFEFTPKEVELLAEMEHGRWNAARLADGWAWGAKKDVDRKISPYLVPWANLPDDIRDYDRQAVATIPALLADEGLGICRL